MVRIAAVGDLHGNLPEIPSCDLLLVAGDVCPLASHKAHDQRNFLRGPFADWLRGVPAKEIVWIAGNHDFVCQAPGFYRLLADIPGHYLCDEGIELFGIKIWGSPWSPHFGPWAFMGSEDELEQRYAKIDPESKIVISHSPPHGHCDFAAGMRVGSSSLARRLKELQSERAGDAGRLINICGHIHEGYGSSSWEGYSVYNVSLVDEFYEPVNSPLELSI